MRVSLTARYVSHPTIDFGGGRSPLHRPRLGLRHPTTVYHRPRRSLHAVPTIGSLRSQTSRYTFPSIGTIGRASAHRARLPLGRRA